jgi:threonine aldolase
VAELAARFDVVMVSLSKGLGAPGGSVVAASRDRIPALVRYRRMSGGAMRQVGIFAAAGLWALDHNVERLAEDHASARAIAARLAESQAYVIDPATVDTNILVWQVADGAPDARTIVERARERGVLIFALGPRTFWAVTHLDITDEQCATAAEILVAAASE